jgi:hypothetical protein
VRSWTGPDDPDPFELATAAFVIFAAAVAMYVFTLVAGFGP